MPAEKGIFLDILPRFDLVAMGAILSKVEGMFSKSGAAIGTTFGKEAEANIARLAEAERKSANVTEDAEIRKTRAIHATEIAEQQATLATDRRVLAAQRLSALQASETVSENTLTAAKLRVEAATIAETRATYVAGDAALAQTARTRDLATATGLSAAAHDKHAAAVAASAVTATNAGRAFNLAGVALAGGFLFAAGESTKMAGNFQQSLIKLQASAGETGTMVSGNLKVVSDGILQLAGQVGISANTLAESMFLVEKAGFRGGDGIKVLTAAAQLANAEGADLNDTINGLTTTMNDFGYKTDQAAVVASKMNVAAGDSKAPLQQFSSALHNVEPTAAMAKIGLDEVYAAMARITQSGAGADQASEWLNNTIGHLMNMNDQQKTFLQQIGMDPVGLQQDLSNKNIGMNGVITEISNKIKSELNPAQQLVLNTQFQSVQAVQSMNTIYDRMGPKAKALADQIKAGTADKSTLQDLRVGRLNEPDIIAWKANFDKLASVNTQLKKGQGDLMGVAAAFAKAFGTDSGLKVVSLLAGTPEQAKAMTDEITRLAKTTAEANGTVKGFDETQAGLNKRMADAKAGFGAAVIQLGNDFIPAMTHVADALKVTAQFLAAHKGLLDTLVYGLGLAGGAWVAMKVKMMATDVWAFLTSSQAKAVAGQDAVTAAAVRTNEALAAAGPAAAKGAATVATAEASEVVAVDSVTTAANTAKLGLMGVLSAGVLAFEFGQKEKEYQDSHPQDFPGAQQTHEAEGKGMPAYSNALQNQIDQLPGGRISKGLPIPGPGQDKNNTVDRRGLIPGSATGGPTAPAGADDPLAALKSALGTPGDAQSTIPIPDWNGGIGGSGAGAPAAPVGTQNNPIYIDPSAITDGVNSSDMGASGSVGGGIMDIFTNAGSGGFTLPNIAKLMGTFVANLALGNPAGKLATGVGMGGDNASLDLGASDIENMTPTQRIETQNTIRMLKAKRAYAKALREYKAAVSKYGAGSDQALNAEDAVFNAQDSIDSTMLSQQQAGGTAAQTFADDQAKGLATKNPGKYAKDQAAAAAYSGGSVSGAVPAGPGAEGWRNTVAQTVDKYGPQMGVTSANRQKWIDSIVSQIDTESKGNPIASNPNDSNGRGGTQDVEGLLQYLPSSYANSGGKLTGLPYMDPVGQIAGALFAPRNADGSPSGIGHGIGWGPVNTPIGPAPAAAPAPSGPTAGDHAQAAAGGGMSLSDFLPGGGQGPIFKRSPAPPAPGPSHEVFGPGGLATGMQPNQPGMVYDRLGRAFPQTPAGPATPGPGGGPLAGILGRSNPQFAPHPGAAPPPPPAPAGGGNAVNGVTPSAGSPSVGQAASQGLQSSQPPQGSGKGFNVSGGLIGGAEGAAAMAANAFAPGAGAAVQIATQEANRAAAYMGQVAGIAAGGLLETFTLHGGNGGKGGWLSKLAGGLAGAHPSIPNAAGTAQPVEKKDDPSKSAPPLKPGDAPPGAPKPGDPNSPGPGNGNNTIHIQNQNINHDDGGANNRDALRQLQAFNT